MFFDGPASMKPTTEQRLPVKKLINGAHQAQNRGLEKALNLQQPIARANVERLRRDNPDMTPAQVLACLNREYLAALSIAGIAAGIAATSGQAQISIPAALGDVLALTDATVLYVLSVAEIHDLHSEDFERRRLLVMAVMLGDAAAGAINKAVGRVGPHWAKQITNTIPMSMIRSINAVLGPHFVTKYGTKQGVLVLSKQLPRGIGAVLGGVGNHLIGRGVIKAAHNVFGAVPATWPDS